MKGERERFPLPTASQRARIGLIIERSSSKNRRE
jgi:hypothetical protein